MTYFACVICIDNLMMVPVNLIIFFPTTNLFLTKMLGMLLEMGGGGGGGDITIGLSFMQQDWSGKKKGEKPARSSVKK